MPDSSSSRNHLPERYFTVSHPGERPDRSVGSSAFRERLRAIRTDQDRNPTGKIQAILRLGADHFGVDDGHLAAIDPARGTHTITPVGEGTVVRVRLPRWTGSNATGDGDRTEELAPRRGPDDQGSHSTHRSK